MHQQLFCALVIAGSYLVNYKLKKRCYRAVSILRPAINFLGQHERIDEQPIVPGERDVNEVQFWLGLTEVEGV